MKGVFEMLIYEIKSIPDLTLSKYQVFADSGIDGMLEAQLQFIKQLNRVALLGGIHLHFVYDYDPNMKAGSKLSIYIIFSGNEQNKAYYIKLRKIINASNISEYFQFKEIQDSSIINIKYTYMSTIRKKERFLQTVINDDVQYFYLVPNWIMNDNARLYNMMQLMASFDERCCYRVDLYVEEDLEEKIHKNFERPLTFLRNLSNKERGISEYSKKQISQRDPNADETLHQYEEWLKSIDNSSVFRSRICAFSNDEQYCQLLLNSVMSEAVKSGNTTTIKKDGTFTAFDYINVIPTECHLNDAPKSMQDWSTTFTAEEIDKFVRLPVLYDGENIELLKETAIIQENEGIIIGKNKNNYPFSIPQNLLTKHMFICGVPGSGKTNTMLNLANSLWNYEIEINGQKQKLHIPFLVLEPAKKEYRELALLDIPELIIFSPSACTNFPIKINPFEFPKGLTLSERIGKLCQVFEGAFPIAPPAPFILDRAIQTVYENHGWNVKDINTGTKTYPLMSELYNQFEKELLATNYDSEIQGNIRSVLEMRIGSLLRREMKEIFDVPKSTLSPEEWLTKPIVIELESLGEGPANFVTLLLCTLIRETLKANPLADKDKPVRHAIFIEEAHNLIAPESQVKDGQDSNPKIAATAFIVKMLAEVRALRECIIIADQLPTAMAPEVIKNTNIKLVHRLTSSDDRELVGSTMSASPLQMENMAIYTSGQALFTYEKLLRPFEIQVNLLEEHGNCTLNDDELYDIMLKKPVFYELHRAETQERWDKIKTQCKRLVEIEKIAVRQLIGLNFIDMQYKEFETYVESFDNILNVLNTVKRIYKLSCISISDKFIPKKNKDEMIEIISNIGVRYEEKICLIVNIWRKRHGEP